jgi:DNA modification methylase
MKKSQSSIKTGDIFLVGEHVIACGDCQDTEFMKKVLKGRTINAIVSDVPYGVAVAESKRGFSALKKDKAILNDHLQSDEEYAAFTEGWITALKPYLARKNSFYVFNADKMIFALREGMLKAGCKFAQLLIWVKTHAVIGRLDYAPQHELIAYGWLGVHEFMKSKDKSVIVYPKPNKSPLHPSTKPVGLIRHLVLNSTKIGDTVIDPFLGSGTAVVACEETKRKCIGVEIEPEYCQTAIDRMGKLFNLKVKKL